MAGTDIWIHAPTTGSDGANIWSQLFRFTLPIRGATVPFRVVAPYKKFRFTLPVRGTTFRDFFHRHCAGNLDSRSPYGERLKSLEESSVIHQFRFTLPVWGATTNPKVTWRMSVYLDSRSPYGERRYIQVVTNGNNAFRFTLPIWGATLRKARFAIMSHI